MWPRHQALRETARRDKRPGQTIKLTVKTHHGQGNAPHLKGREIVADEEMAAFMPCLTFAGALNIAGAITRCVMACTFITQDGLRVTP